MVLEILFFLFLLSLIFYLIFLYILIKNRKNDDFNSPFFTFCIFLGVHDIIFLVNGWIFLKLSILGWFGMNQLLKRFRSFFQIAYSLLTCQASMGQQIGMAAVAVNRYTAICRFASHAEIWKDKVVIGVIVAQFLCPLPIAVYISFWGQLVFPMDNSTGVLTGKPYYSNTDVRLVLSVIFGLLYLGNNLLMLILYGLIVRTLRQHVNQVVALGQTTELSGTEKKMVFFGLSLFAMNLTFTVVSVLSGSVSPEKNMTAHLVVTRLFLIVGDFLAYCNPYFMLLFSKIVRKHFHAIIRCKPTPA